MYKISVDTNYEQLFEEEEEEEEEIPIIQQEDDFFATYSSIDLPDIWLYDEEDLTSDQLEGEENAEEEEHGELEASLEGQEFVFRPMIRPEEGVLQEVVMRDAELMLLESSHPQMQRFQASLKERYERKIEETNERLSATQFNLKRLRKKKQSIALKLNFLQVCAKQQ